MHLSVHMSIHMSAHMSIHMSAHLCACTPVHMHVYTQAYTHVRTSSYTCLYTCPYACPYTGIRTRTRLRSSVRLSSQTQCSCALCTSSRRPAPTPPYIVMAYIIMAQEGPRPSTLYSYGHKLKKACAHPTLIIMAYIVMDQEGPRHPTLICLQQLAVGSEKPICYGAVLFSENLCGAKPPRSGGATGLYKHGLYSYGL